MTETLQKAAHNTALILDQADRVRELLAGDGAPRSNGAGVLVNPRDYLAALRAARELIDQEGRTVKEAAALLGVHRSTLYRALDSSEEVSQAEAKRRGAFREDALTEDDAVAAAGQDERQEQRA